MRSTRALLHLENLRHNISVCLDIAKGRKVCLAVKANGYGHGALFVAKTAVSMGVSHLGVATADEALELCTARLPAKIVLLGMCAPQELPELIRAEVELICPDAQTATSIAAAAKTAANRDIGPSGSTNNFEPAVHIKVDTGMGRLGCRPGDLYDVAKTVRSLGLKIAGVATHFPVSEDPDPAFTQNQVKDFAAAVDGLKAAGIDPGLVHAANSGGLTLHENARFDMIRPGIMAYGYPAGKVGFDNLDLKPVMELRSTVAFIKEVPDGTGISYGLRYHTQGPRWIATLPVGYADGLPRLASGKLRFTHLRPRPGAANETRSYPQVGTICMDQCMVDLGPSRDAQRKLLPCPVELWDEFVIFGPGKAVESAESVGAAIGTIAYEITCGINGRVPRVVV